MDLRGVAGRKKVLLQPCPPLSFPPSFFLALPTLPSVLALPSLPAPSSYLHLALFCHCLVLSCLVLPCLVLSCLVLSCLVLSCLVLSCLLLSCLVFSCLVFSCLVLTLTLATLPPLLPFRNQFYVRAEANGRVRCCVFRRTCRCIG